MTNPTVTSASYAALESAINAALNLDQVSLKKIAQYEGRVIQASCTQPDISIYIRVGEKIDVMQHYEYPAEASISGDLSAWLQLIASEDPAATLVNSSLIISGDSHLFMELKTVAESMDLDWEGYLAGFIGDVPARLTSQTTSRIFNFAKRARKTLHRTANDFLHEEARLLPTRTELDSFYRQLRKEEMKIDRLQAKLNAVKQRAEQRQQ